MYFFLSTEIDILINITFNRMSQIKDGSEFIKDEKINSIW